MSGIVEYLLANPIYIAPILLMVAMVVFAVLKRLLKLALIAAITAGLYLLLVEYLGGGL